MLKVGTICVGQNHQYQTHRNGQECEILAPLKVRTVRSVKGVSEVLCYRVRWADGTIRAVSPENIRPKKPPAEYKGEKTVMDLFLKEPQHA